MTGKDMADLAFAVGTGLNRMGSQPAIRWVECDACDGLGWYFHHLPPDGIELDERYCESCDGSGFVSVEPGDTQYPDALDHNPRGRG